MISLLSDLMGHSEWANAVFFHAWSKSPAKDNEEMRKRLDHLIGVQQGFLSMLRGETPGGPTLGPSPSFEGLRARAIASHEKMHEFVAALNESALSQVVRVPWFGEPPCIISTTEALVQVAMHSQHHRGQCMTRLKDLGGEPKNVDYVIWLWKQKPKARWQE